MDVRDVHLAAVTHLNDLQAGVEAGSRTIESINRGAALLQHGLMTRSVEQAATVAALLSQIRELRGSVRQQLHILRELRRDIRELRSQTQQSSPDSKAEI